MPSDNAPKTEQLDLVNNPKHAKQASEALRALSDVELSQGSASPWAFIGRVPGFTQNMAVTKAGGVLAQLARNEQQRRRDAEAQRQFQVADRRAKGSLVVSRASLVVSVLALIIAVIAL